MKPNEVRTTLKEIYKALEEGQYDASSQIVGYLTSGDPGYISTIDNARSKIISLDRQEVIKILLEEFLEK